MGPCCHGDSGTVTPIIYLPFCRAAFCRSVPVISPDTCACDSVPCMRMRGEENIPKVFQGDTGETVHLALVKAFISIESHVNKHIDFI